MIMIILILIAIFALFGCVKIKKPALRVFLGSIAVMALVLGTFAYVIHYRIRLVDASASPDGAYEILFQQVGDPEFPFGRTHARLVLRKGNRTVIKKSIEIADDGTNASPNNWDVRWEEASVEVMIYGDEQYDVQYTLNFDGTQNSKQLDTQYGRTEQERFQNGANEVVEEPTKQNEESKGNEADVEKLFQLTKMLIGIIICIGEMPAKAK